MKDRDPFAEPEPDAEDTERTIILPAPGGKPRQAEERPLSRPPVLPPVRVEAESANANPLLRAAAGAFALVTRLADTPAHEDVPGLRERVISMVREFEVKARDFGAANESAYAARYTLSALIDETVLATPWGSQSAWDKQTILATLHNETSGGERFFQILDRMSENPARNIDLLEFLYFCLCLGFQGKYGVVAGGAARLEKLTHDLYRTISKQRSEAERVLSPNWQGVTSRRPKVSRYIPLWVVPIAAGALAVMLFLAFSYDINRRSDEVFAALNSLGREALQLGTPEVAEPMLPEPEPVAGPTLYERVLGLLQNEVERGAAGVVDLGHAVKIVLHNKGLFASGSATVAESYQPLIDKIGIEIRDEPGPILVTGHTDSQPIRTLKYPSNWHLSSARATAVAAILEDSLGEKAKMTIEGRADTEPIAPNDTAEGRERNRRVEIKVSVK